VAVGAPGCVRYTPAPLRVEAGLHTMPPPSGAIAYLDAIRWALEHNPELRALRLRACVAGSLGAAEPVEFGAGRGSDERTEAGLSVDALSVLGLRTRATDRALARARGDEGYAAYLAGARSLAGDLAELYAVDAALAALPPVDSPTSDARVFVEAGLDAPAAEAAAEATAAEAGVEREERARQRREVRRSVGRLLGANVDGLELVPAATDWPRPPAATDAAVVAGHPGVQRVVAAFEVSDRELRRAVAAQFPSLVLEPEVAADPTALFGMVRLRLPVGAGREVRAAEMAREAARAEVDAAVLEAVARAKAAGAELAQTELVTRAARARLSAAQRLLAATRTRMVATGGSITETVFSQDAVLGAAAGLRDAVTAEARARVRAATAAGWPSEATVR
jgi:outer membrane protein TolC